MLLYTSKWMSAGSTVEIPPTPSFTVHLISGHAVKPYIYQIHRAARLALQSKWRSSCITSCGCLTCVRRKHASNPNVQHSKHPQITSISTSLKWRVSSKAMRMLPHATQVPTSHTYVQYILCNKNTHHRLVNTITAAVCKAVMWVVY